MTNAEFTHFTRNAVLGAIHLLPLPGAPTAGPSGQDVVDAALRDAEALAQGGAQGCVIENFGDAPFSPGAAEPHVVAWMARICAEIQVRFGAELRVGVNVLRNSAIDALAIASAADACFIRVNVHSGVMVTDQGILEGSARETLLYRRRLGLKCAIAADVRVKHAAPLADIPLEQEARDTFLRGRADILILTGAATGSACDPDRLERVRAALPQAPLWLGSGLTPSNAELYRSRCDAAIVGTWFHDRGEIGRPFDPARVRELVEAFAG